MAPLQDCDTRSRISFKDCQRQMERHFLEVSRLHRALYRVNLEHGSEYRGYLPKQVDALKAAHAGLDVLVVLPTGYGKSLIFKSLPHLTDLPGRVVIASPLDAIIHEQASRMGAIVVDGALIRKYFDTGIPSGRDITTEKSKASWELRKGNVGVYAIQGRRPHMEDRFNVVNELEHTNTSIYGIFDGHGGEFAADFVEKTLFKTIMVRLLKAALAEQKEDFATVLTEEILNVDKQLLQVEKLTNEVSGTTALVALLRGDQLTVANVGDSRGVICDKDGKAIPVSFDHKPQQMRERKRIKKAGGFISFNGVWRVAGVLATSRALGDYPLKEKNFVIADPDNLTFDLAEMQPRFMILATDGLWDTFTNEEAVMYINERLDEPHFGAKSLVLQAYYRGSLDNISVMVINFKERPLAKIARKGSA